MPAELAVAIGGVVASVTLSRWVGQSVARYYWGYQGESVKVVGRYYMLLSLLATAVGVYIVYTKL